MTLSGLGKQAPTLFLTNNQDAVGREIITRYTKRNTIENDLGINVNFFHLNCLASEMRLNVNLDIVLTLMANGCKVETARKNASFVVPLRGTSILVCLPRAVIQPGVNRFLASTVYAKQVSAYGAMPQAGIVHAFSVISDAKA